MFTQHHSNDLFVELETGRISESDFYEAFRKGTGTNLSDEAIKTAWNALLLDFRDPTLQWLANNKDKYRLFLFSNTNQIHHDAFIAAFEAKTGKADFDAFLKSLLFSKYGDAQTRSGGFCKNLRRTRAPARGNPVYRRYYQKYRSS